MSKSLSNDITWTDSEYLEIASSLQRAGKRVVKERAEYIALSEVIDDKRDDFEDLQNAQNQALNLPVDYSVKSAGILPEVHNFRQIEKPAKPLKSRVSGGCVKSPYCNANRGICTPSNKIITQPPSGKPFLAPLDVQNKTSIGSIIPSFQVVQSDGLCINIGFDTEFQNFENSDNSRSGFRKVLSLQMSIQVGSSLIRYFFLVNPSFQDITAEDGGRIPLKYCLADILSDLQQNYFPDLPLVRKEKLIFVEKKDKSGKIYKEIDYSAMKDDVIPISIICHTGKADISVLRRTKYDVDLLSHLAEIQGGWMSTSSVRIRAENDPTYSYYWLVSLVVRDTLGLTPADNKSLKALGEVIHKQKISLDADTISQMSSYAVCNPVGYYDYAMNDADIVVAFCSELFQANHTLPMTLSSAAALSMYKSISNYFHASTKSEYDKKYRGLQMLKEGILKSPKEALKFLQSSRYVPLRENPDTLLMSDFFGEAYTGGFNSSFMIGWFDEQTTDFDLRNAYPTAMACVIDIDWSQYVRDFPRNFYISLQDIVNPLIPAVAVGDFDFPDDCYCPNIPVQTSSGLKIYPLHGRNVYMTGVDMYLALRLGAKIKVFRGFTCQMLQHEDGTPSRCLGYAVASLVQDRAMAQEIYGKDSLVDKTLKQMVCSCYGKTAQNVAPKTRYNAVKQGRVDAGPSIVTSPYHSAYTTALVRCMLIACINQLHDMGYKIYSVTTDGFITNASLETLRSLDAYGFTNIFQEGRYLINQTREDCKENHVWEAKHFNDALLNITTRGNVAVNDEGVLAHNSYTTGEEKGSRADRDAYIIAVLSRNGRLKCSAKVWTEFSEIIERKHDFCVSETLRHLRMNFDYKRLPLLETTRDITVHYESAGKEFSVDTVIAEFDTRPFVDADEFSNFRKASEQEDCIKVKKDLERVELKATVKHSGYVGRNADKKILMSIIMGYKTGVYRVPPLDGLSQKQILETVNSWKIVELSLSDVKNCARASLQKNMLPYEGVKKMLTKISKFTGTDCGLGG